jgi:hypothetical protein
MRQNRIYFSLASCTLAAVLTVFDCHKNFIPRLVQQVRQARATHDANKGRGSIASISNPYSSSILYSVSKSFPDSIVSSRPSEQRFKVCPRPLLSGGRSFVLTEREAQASFISWSRNCGLRLPELVQNLPALWHYCQAGVVASCTTLARTIRARLTEQGLEERAFPTPALETLEASESKACEGGIISSCEFTTYYARLLENVAGFPSDRSLRQVDATLSSLCRQAHPGACGELGLRLASSGRVEGNATDVNEGVRLLSKACVEGQTFRCSQVGHFADEAGRDVVLNAVRRGCARGETSSCLYLYEHPNDGRDRWLAKQWLWKSCRTAVPGAIDQIGHRACNALGVRTVVQARDPKRL